MHRHFIPSFRECINPTPLFDLHSCVPVYCVLWTVLVSIKDGTLYHCPLRYKILSLKRPKHDMCSAQTQTRMGCLRKSPEVEFDSYRWLSHLGVRAPYAAQPKRRYEVNQVWMNTTFISQGPQSWGKLAVETWRVKTELIIITILHIIIITTSILNLGFKTIRQNIGAHKCINKYWKYTQIFAATKTRQNLFQKIIKYWHLPKIFTHA